MSEIYYALIILPILFMVVLAFIFQESLEELTNQQFLLSCPYPIQDGIATLNGIEDNGIFLNYTIAYGSLETGYNGTYFQCTLDPLSDPPRGANAQIKPYGATLFSVIPYGQLAYYGDTVYHFFTKWEPAIRMVWLFWNAPALVTGLAFFSYINGVLTGLVILGGFLVIRSGS